ncbi:hypothetical protein GGR57DRAFT_504739 [Xylariaceae sp. FL1272]|nr:hypothetical protein GGR57DRAFT_504739 [Xylariaceae sp. FL1272]
MDIVAHLPLELLIETFLLLSIDDLGHSLQVSRTWRAQLLSEDFHRFYGGVRWPNLLRSSSSLLVNISKLGWVRLRYIDLHEFFGRPKENMVERAFGKGFPTTGTKVSEHIPTMLGRLIEKDDVRRIEEGTTTHGDMVIINVGELLQLWFPKEDTKILIDPLPLFRDLVPPDHHRIWQDGEVYLNQHESHTFFLATAFLHDVRDCTTEGQPMATYTVHEFELNRCVGSWTRHSTLSRSTPFQPQWVFSRDYELESSFIVFIGYDEDEFPTLYSLTLFDKNKRKWLSPTKSDETMQVPLWNPHNARPDGYASYHFDLEYGVNAEPITGEPIYYYNSADSTDWYAGREEQLKEQLKEWIHLWRASCV